MGVRRGVCVCPVLSSGVSCCPSVPDVGVLRGRLLDPLSGLGDGVAGSKADGLHDQAGETEAGDAVLACSVFLSIGGMVKDAEEGIGGIW